jgi:proliferating cell nuclear antigen
MRQRRLIYGGLPDDFQDLCHIDPVAHPEGFALHSEGENDRVDLRLPKESLLNLETTEPTRSMYPLDFFSNMVKSIVTAETVNLALGNQYPLKLDFTLASGNGDGEFLLAPRVTRLRPEAR